MQTRHFLQLRDLKLEEFEYLFRRARTLKERLGHGEPYHPLRNKSLAMIFEKNSTRTRVSVEVGMNQLGGSALFLSQKDTQLGRGETVEDAARVLSRMVDIVMIRTFAQDIVDRFAAHSRVPVINGLTDEYHPCQIMADIFTYIEHRGSLKGRTVAWVGDGNNVCRTWAQAAAIFGFRLHIASPRGYELDPASVAGGDPGLLEFTDDPCSAVRGADLVTTDVWTSMGFEQEARSREQAFAGYCVDSRMMALAQPDALFMHCLPAHRGMEVEAEVIDGPQSVVWEEAENRLHTQKALMEYLMIGKIRSNP